MKKASNKKGLREHSYNDDPQFEDFSMETPNLTMISAKRNSGKTHLISHMVHQVAKAKCFDTVLIICPTAFNELCPYRSFCNNIIQTFDEDMIQSIMDRQQKLIKAGKYNRLLLILDDCVSKANFKHTVYETIATQGRHYLVTCWVTSQHYTKIPPIIRTNCDYMMMLGNQSKDSMKKVFEELGGEFENERQFIRIVKPELENYGVFVINHRKSKICRMKAPEIIPRFLLKQN